MSRLRVACTSLGRRIMAGYPTKDGQRLKEPRHDVTSDVLRAVADMIEVGHEITVVSEGVAHFRIAILPPADGASSASTTDASQASGTNP